MTKSILLDTNLWYFGLATPHEPTWRVLHEQAAEFLSHVLQAKDTLIALSSYQIAEILELLRKVRYPPERCSHLLESFGEPKFRVVDVTHDMVDRCVELSLASGIHVYDYLVALPLQGLVTAIYSADDHFQHADFQRIAPVTNPLAPWVLREGRKPVRK